MLHWEIELALNEAAEEKKKWAVAYQDFRRGYDHVLNRLIHEGIANWMSVEQIAKAAGMTPKGVRLHMRRQGLEPKNGRSALAHAAAEALRTNAELLGVDPLDMDLTSPLAYLPMGSDLRNKLQSEAVRGVKDEHRCVLLEIVQDEQEIWILRCPECGQSCPAESYLKAFEGFVSE